MTYKAPGVYIREQPSLPSSVVQLSTAVPAFIGYTEKANFNAADRWMTPVRLSSLLEFEAHFGGPPKPVYRLAQSNNADPQSAFTMSDPEVRDPLRPVTIPGQAGAGAARLIQTNPAYCLYAAMRMFFNNGGGPCFVTSAGPYTSDHNADDMLQAIDALPAGPEPTLLIIPETTRLTRADAAKVQRAMLLHCGVKTRNRFAILDIYAGHLAMDGPAGDPVAAFRGDIGQDALSYGAAYYPWLNTSVYEAGDFTFEAIVNADRKDFAAMLKAAAAPDPTLDAVLDRIVPASDTQSSESGHGDVSDDQVDQALRAAVPLYKDIMHAIAQRENCVPPGAAYTAVDQSRGVWKAPANVSVSAAFSAAVGVSHVEQESLNAPLGGKAVNALRMFAGEGVMVWGAKTLDGNSLEGRYIPVRRALLMIEDSLRYGLVAYVFEPNEAPTWAAIRASATAFLSNLFRQGALAGARESDAFHVSIGFGETMTAGDIDAGRMVLTVLVALVRPAEFIEITIEQQVQEA